MSFWMKWYEQMRFKTQGVNIFCVHAGNVEKESGKINTLRIVGECKDRQNSIVETWNTVGWEKTGESPITYIGEDGVKKCAYVVGESGTTISLYTAPRELPNLERVIGAGATLDDIADAMDLDKSKKQLVIGLIAGVFIGWLIIGPMMGFVSQMLFKVASS